MGNYRYENILYTLLLQFYYDHRAITSRHSCVIPSYTYRAITIQSWQENGEVKKAESLPPVGNLLFRGKFFYQGQLFGPLFFCLLFFAGLAVSASSAFLF